MMASIDFRIDNNLFLFTRYSFTFLKSESVAYFDAKINRQLVRSYSDILFTKGIKLRVFGIVDD